ncbi:hypothetical protein [Portibacter lacus]|uniref:Uncharacterized protein n=1 Tax=Portibacter lacus TaxID=1099794 RepID=A0AA37WD23_9BACT|nr:hypothetical protein [Portibacter lacus]GLR17471.1 hypothetical protein GCM10007940_20860 [Portibacter lacus]
MDQLIIYDIFNLDPDISECSIQFLLKTELKPTFISLVSKNLHLVYQENYISEGKVCFADDPELNPAYRTTFHKLDIICYLLSFYSNAIINPTNKLRITRDVTGFWKQVALGRRIYDSLENK